MDLVTLIVFLTLTEYIVFIAIVGGARNKYGVAAPATTGNSQWERLHRIQVNTTEQLVLFIPAIYGFAYYVSELWAVGIGAIFVLGRVIYFFSYRKNPDKRIVGAAMSGLPSYVLVMGTFVGLIQKLF